MGRKSQIFIVAVVVFLIGGAVGAYAYDGAQKDQIADGVTVSGVDVGGMSREEATTAVQNQVLAPQRKPVTVTYGNKTYKLPVNKLKIRANVNAGIDQAFAKSRDGSLPTRLVREVTGGTVDAAVPVKVTYSQRAVNQFVRDVAGKVNVEPVDATVSGGADGLSVVKGQDGHKLRDNLLTTQLTSLLDKGEGARTIAVKTTVTKPKVTTKQVASEYPSYLTLDRSTFTLRLWKNLKLEKAYTVAVGMQGLETPEGLYHIQDKQVDPVWTVPNSAWAGDMAGQVVPGGTPENPLKARWMGIYNGAGIHGTDETYSLGTAGSHGCVRMAIPDVIDLYDRVDVGTPIYIG